MPAAAKRSGGNQAAGANGRRERSRQRLRDEQPRPARRAGPAPAPGAEVEPILDVGQARVPGAEDHPVEEEDRRDGGPRAWRGNSHTSTYPATAGGPTPGSAALAPDPEDGYRISGAAAPGSSRSPRRSSRVKGPKCAVPEKRPSTFTELGPSESSPSVAKPASVDCTTQRTRPSGRAFADVGAAQAGRGQREAADARGPGERAAQVAVADLVDLDLGTGLGARAAHADGPANAAAASRPSRGSCHPTRRW